MCYMSPGNSSPLSICVEKEWLLTEQHAVLLRHKDYGTCTVRHKYCVAFDVGQNMEVEIT